VNAVERLGVFGVVLAGVFGIGLGAGAAFGPTASTKEEMPPAPIGEGVVSAEEGYRFVPATRQLAEDGGTFRFVIDGPDGSPVLEFQEEHDKELHLIVVNRDLTVFNHVHPTRAADGTWSIDLPALPAGSYRAVADFHVAGGPRFALGTDVSVAGDFVPTALTEPAATSSVDGYEVTLESEAGAGGDVEIALTVRKDGRVVTDLQPYLGAFGHLVAMRTGDLAYAHVHPDDALDGTVHFDAELNAEGRYGMFFDFKHGDTVHTATFTFDQGLVTDAPATDH
jgi:hypothetical protein